MIQGGRNKNANGLKLYGLGQQQQLIQSANHRTSRAARHTMHSAGFTIVETLIVLAVTGIMLTTAILYIGGKQNKTQFMTAVNDLQQQLQQTINETSSGYPGQYAFKCQASSSSTIPPQATFNPGASNNCVFVGKAIQFGTNNDASQLVVWPLVGSQQVTDNGKKRQAQTLTETHPTAAYKDISNEWSTSYRLESGLTIVSSGSTGGGLAVITSLGGYGSNGLNSGSQQFSGYSITGSSPQQSKQDFVSAVNVPSNLVLADIKLCVKSGSTDQFATYTITGQSLTVAMQIGTACS